MSEDWFNRIRHVGMNRYEIDMGEVSIVLEGEVMEAIAEWWAEKITKPVYEVAPVGTIPDGRNVISVGGVRYKRVV